MSEVIKLLQIVWDNANAKTRFSYERLNHSMSAALSLAVGSGMEFQLNDFTLIAKNYRWQYWAGNSIGTNVGEGFYAEAVIVGNISACQSYEEHVNRGPFIMDRVMARGSRYTRSRVAIGFDVEWKGECRTITAMKKDYLIACTYREPPRKIVKSRVNITVKDIREQRAKKKAFAKDKT